eukprot:CAMPEP_0202366878 /NCGR_PEP_ID=MMETSP1126-20121109/17315_1 /ASSEMBLY_ACC=CAM_ASM_000457 /TAXON_ID=3047 /ORGANISM="Dunaliella tertiolecta, Strain CCMP1320" /LENGTH=64 /DNA_ID=CAMNT_0048962019 /DNA_START=464 /DNA_END=658 /DNA_ORIENTATION=-
MGGSLRRCSTIFCAMRLSLLRAKLATTSLTLSVAGSLALEKSDSLFLATSSRTHTKGWSCTGGL